MSLGQTHRWTDIHILMHKQKRFLRNQAHATFGRVRVVQQALHKVNQLPYCYKYVYNDIAVRGVDNKVVKASSDSYSNYKSNDTI